MDITQKNNYSTFVHPDYCVLQDFMKLALLKWLDLKDEDINNYHGKEVWVRIRQFVAGRDDFVGFFSRVINAIETDVNYNEEMRRRSM